MTEPRRSLTCFSLFLIGCTVLSLSGCKKESETSGPGGEMAEIAISAMDLNPDGSIAPRGLQKIDEVASKGAFNVYFVRAPLSDAGLAQLGKYQGLHRVEAIGCKLSAGAIGKLKKASPESEVAK